MELTLEPPPRCQGCDGACRWYGADASRRLTVTTQSTLAIGTRVSVSVAGRELLRGAAIVYGVPLAGLLGGAWVGFAVWGSDLGTAAGAGTALTAALVVARGLRARLERRTRYALTVVPAG
jgi:positive regulator of sigma E activity